MKKLFILFVASFVLTTTASAQQKGDVSIGVGATYGFANELVGLGGTVKLRWNIANMVRIEPSYTYFFGGEGSGGVEPKWDASLNLHYQFVLSKKLAIYPLVGVSCLSFRDEYGYENRDGEWVTVDETATDLGGNFGVGIDYKITPKWVLNLEAQGKISIWSGAVASVGIAYKF